MGKRAYLVLGDGSIYEGEAFGSEAFSHGEVVFNTSMTGYQEMLTDPSYAGQIVLPTYPLIGNYGINDTDVESHQIQVAGFVVREHCRNPSHYDNAWTLHQYLAYQGITGICNVDTRAVVRRLRSSGVMMGAIVVHQTPEEALHRLKGLPKYGSLDFVQGVTTPSTYQWDDVEENGVSYRIVVVDYGLKFNILRVLHQKQCMVTVMPAGTSAQEIMELRPDGIVFSPGPGDPGLLEHATKTARSLIGKVPIMGICLGHQLLARALGGRTYKLKFGHRGANHPVRDLETGRVHITAQNHGYAVDADSLPHALEVSHVNLNDGVVEGLRHREMPLLSIQYHSEGSPGPRDNEYLFDRFLSIVKEVSVA